MIGADSRPMPPPIPSAPSTDSAPAARSFSRGELAAALAIVVIWGTNFVLMQTQVFFTAIFGFALLGERPGRPLQAGLALAAAALVCFALPYVLPHEGPASGGTTALGFVLNLCSAASWGASNIVARKAQA